MHSCHVFIFPFRWELNDPGDDPHNIEAIKSLLKQPPWKYSPFKVDTPENYSLWAYFYDFAREGLLDFKDEDENHEVLRHYQYNVPEGSLYKISTGQTLYELDIEKIELEFYATGVAFLVFFLNNNRHPEFQDILNINEYGRRIYPQYLRFLKDKGATLTTDTKNKFLASGITLEIQDGNRFFDDFSYFDNLDNVERNPNRLPEFILDLLGKQSFDTRQWTRQVHVQPVVDDRMFVLCWYGNDELAERVTEFSRERQSYAYEQSDEWYAFVFIDKDDPSCQSPPMMRQLLKSSTYDRWAGYNTLYGCSRYSFNVLTQKSAEWLCGHIKTMYYQIVKLTLLQRASILRFSDEASKIADEIKHYDKKKAGDCKLKKLHQDYLWFVNRLYFREVTAQEQGIELYNLMQEKMEISRDIKDLDREIDDLYQFEGLEADRESNRKVTYLTYLAALFLLPTFITGFFGMNIMPASFSTAKISLIFTGIVVLSVLSLWTIREFQRSKKTNSPGMWKLLLILTLAIFSVVLLLPITPLGNVFFGGPL